jgi:membrane protein DedA with SNARE-associated domain
VRHLIVSGGACGHEPSEILLYTLFGAGLWVTVLSYIGYFIGAERELIMQYSNQALIAAVVLSVLVIVVYVWNHRRKKHVIDNVQ